ncbi:MAG: O-methyltransferase [Acidimicrobiales bacterium]
MSQELWTDVDRYICDLLVAPDQTLDAALESSNAAGLPQINVAPNQGKLLHLIARIHGARKILEIGTLGGYSTIWLARSLPPDGQMVTLEIEQRHADVARANIARAGLTGVVTVRVGRAADTLSELKAEGAGPFDLVFIDADKTSSADYFSAALDLIRPGSVIIVDNVVRAGAVIDATSDDPAVQGTRRLNDVMAAERRVSVTEVQTVGIKGYDGFALALVL